MISWSIATWRITIRQIIFAQIMLATTAAAITAANAAAQTSQVAPNAMSGFSQNSDKPVQIKAQSFEVRDKQNTAIFTGNVHVVQGETTIRCKSLIVSYRSDSSADAPRTAQPGPGGKSQIERLEAVGNVIVTQNDQTATGDRGIYDLGAKTVTLIGNVVVSQGGNVMRGQRMVVDLTTGVSRVESGKSGGVEMLIDQSKSNNAKPGAPGAPGALGAPAAPRLDPLRPAQSN